VTVTPLNKDDKSTIDLDDLDEDQLKALVEDVYEKAEEARQEPFIDKVAPDLETPAPTPLDYEAFIDKAKGGRLFPRLDPGREAPHLEGPIHQEGVTTVGEPRQVEADFDRMNATAFIELQRRASMAAQEVSDALRVSCSAEGPKMWAEFDGKNPTPLEDLQFAQGFGVVGEDGEGK
jgi:hypothetical protein